MPEYDLKIRDFSKVPDNQRDVEVLALTNDCPLCGVIRLRELLKGRGFNVERYHLRDSIRVSCTKSVPKALKKIDFQKPVKQVFSQLFVVQYLNFETFRFAPPPPPILSHIFEILPVEYTF